MIVSPLLQHVSGYIDGEWQDAGEGPTFDVHNPANGETLASVAAMGASEVMAAISSACSALKLAQPYPLEIRKQWLEEIREALLTHRDELARILCSEHGKPLAEARGEVDYAAGFFDYCAAHITALAPDVLAERPRGCSWTVHYRPIGVVGLITPWNFPLGMIAKKLSAALAAGCPSVIKPASETPLTMIALFSLLDEYTSLPPGMVNLVMGPASVIGKVLCDSPDVPMLSFTGSTEVGRRLLVETAPQVKKLSLELGGNAPFIVFDDADLEAAVDHLMANKFRGGGQTCVCANRVYVQRGALARFEALLAERVNALTVGDGMADGVDIGPLINQAGFDKVRRHVSDALAKGGTLVAGPDPVTLDNAGLFYPPTVVSGVTAEMDCVREETFGPFVPLAAFDGEQEVVALGNDTEFGLAAYVFTRDPERAQRVAACLRFGHVGWNTGTGPTPEAPFGGMKASGIGREGGVEGLFEFVEPQTIPRGD
ncbi:NAD-dependent succinate-semialdehyde dehydrogenase [Marinobacter zhejiangensis]|uniref:Succinate-semialdehyde dehydrogenase / glutarate-semialdehyde dehydrogenase n=1 Tax=Marinobacter zhejiangensis TaxID=488535 RepID=A0A1I4L7D7_9GAMM|nr:NAD-dependent succinate-semialdehyde dehydrogenase [Marinobacter zhejiangensis]SFL86935.1 succinate-semialdehyde dehydrogenase / glutarate-semialdehyde dehydrogenase [Marinobacter zhejiangensis]